MLEEALKTVPNIMYHTNPRSSDPTIAGLQVTHRDATKFHGIQALRGIIGVSKEKTFGIGDGMNDIPLAENSGFFVAMGSAPDMLKHIADAVVGSVSEEGFADAIQRFVLN